MAVKTFTRSRFPAVLGRSLNSFRILSALILLAVSISCSENGYILSVSPIEEKPFGFSIKPNSVELGDDETSITIKGRGFGEDKDKIRIYFGDLLIDEYEIDSIDDTKIVLLYAPDADDTGFVDVKIILPDGSTVLLEKGFEYRTPIGPEKCDDPGDDEVKSCKEEISNALSAFKTRECLDNYEWEKWKDVTCLVEKCADGYEPNSTDTACNLKASCISSTIQEEDGCTIENGTGKKTRTCTSDGVWPPWGECEVKSCKLGFHEEDGACVPDEESCQPNDTRTQPCSDGMGSGEVEQTCNEDNEWVDTSSCEYTSCVDPEASVDNKCIPPTCTADESEEFECEIEYASDRVGYGYQIGICSADGKWILDSSCEIETCSNLNGDPDNSCEVGSTVKEKDPHIDNLSPSAGVATGNRKFEINGSHFSRNYFRVMLGEENITEKCDFKTNAKIRCETPKYAEYENPTQLAVQVLKKKESKVVAESNLQHYTYDNSAILIEIRRRGSTSPQTDFSPGDEIDLIGERIAAIKDVEIVFSIAGTETKAECDSVNEFGTKLKCQVPKKLSTGSGSVYLRHTFKSFPETTSNILDIKIAKKNDLVPHIVGISPASGVSKGGNTIVITGQNFYHPKVLFGRMPTVNCTVTKSRTEISCEVPKFDSYSEPTSVDVSVKNNQTQATSNKVAYTYDNVPVLNKLTANDSNFTEISVGAEIKLHGMNFASFNKDSTDSEVKVKFQNTGGDKPEAKDGKCTELNAERTALTCKIPKFRSGSTVNVWIKNNFSGDKLENTTSNKMEIKIK